MPRLQAFHLGSSLVEQPAKRPWWQVWIPALRSQDLELCTGRKTTCRTRGEARGCAAIARVSPLSAGGGLCQHLARPAPAAAALPPLPAGTGGHHGALHGPGCAPGTPAIAVTVATRYDGVTTTKKKRGKEMLYVPTRHRRKTNAPCCCAMAVLTTCRAAAPTGFAWAPTSWWWRPRPSTTPLHPMAWLST